jgi:hypothetical protein
MPKENAVKIYGCGGRVFETQEGFDRELLDQVTRAIDALNKITFLSRAECVWHEPSQFGEVKDYLNRKQMHLALCPKLAGARPRHGLFQRGKLCFVPAGDGNCGACAIATLLPGRKSAQVLPVRSEEGATTKRAKSPRAESGSVSKMFQDVIVR